MATLTTTTVTTNNIQSLDNLPNDVQGLTADQLKQTFDKYSVDNNNYINNTLIPELENILSTPPSMVAEVLAARTSGVTSEVFGSVGARLDNVDMSLANNATYVNDISISARKFKTDINTWYDAIQEAINFLPNGGKIVMPAGTLDFGNNTLTINTSGIKLIGAGRDVTKIISTASIGIKIGTVTDGSLAYYGIELEGFTIDGCQGDGIQFKSISDSFVKNVCVQNCTGIGINFNFSWSNTLIRTRSNRNNQGIYIYNSSHAISLFACNITNNTLEGIYIQASNGINISGGSIEQNNKGIYAINTRGLNVSGVYFEADTTYSINLGASATSTFFVYGFNITGNYFNAKYSAFTASTAIIVANGKGKIEGNSFREYTGRAIYITGVKDVGVAKYISCKDNLIENVPNMFSLDGAGTLAVRTGAAVINSSTPKNLSVNDYDGLYVPKITPKSNANIWFARDTTTGIITIYTDSASNIDIYYELSTIGLLY